MLGSERRSYLVFDYLAFDLANQPFERWADSDNLVARLNLPAMRYRPEQRIDVYARAVQGLSSLEPDTDKWAKYIDFIDIYANLTDNELRRYAEKYPQEVDTMAGFAERYRQQGIEQGERTLLTRQIERRFGSLAEATRQKLEEATVDDLNRWADNIIDANTLNDIFDGDS